MAWQNVLAPDELTTAQIVLSLVLSLAAAAFVYWDAGRVGRSRWWSVLPLLSPAIGLIVWLVWRTWGPKPQAPPSDGAHGNAAPVPGGPTAGAHARRCPQCNATDVGEFSFCKKCGADLPE